MNDYIVSINSSKLNVKVLSESEIVLNTRKYIYELIPVSTHSYILKLDNKVFELSSEKINGELFKVLLNGFYLDVVVRTALQEKAFKLLENAAVFQHHHTELKAPMPGLILKVRKKAGEKVEQGESIIILEAMKMENDLKSPATGIIENLFVSEGTAVEKGAILLSIG